ncbi:MAG: HDIG domain-containing protein [Brevefilum sp.]|nr:HDIG domain-containing protein [Brevefilum sp.]MDT8382447.1 HDIG domain-containing protein [Brevefilum sp.]MDW7755971.1 HDIG domain-containing protein [Brevefilum sp.]
MQLDLRILTPSRSLYRRTFQAFEGELPVSESFAIGNGIRIQFIRNGIAFEADPVDVTAYLDDDYDPLCAAALSGHKTIWFNPAGVLAEDDFPRHDVEIQDVSELININSRLHKPSLTQCLAWLDEWDVPDNVLAHSAVVARSAYVLAVMMRNRGISVDPVLTHRGGLLHDIDKIETLKMYGAHGRMGAEFLDAQGYPRLAEILREHIMTRVMRPEALDWGWEVRLVFFCDKLVEGDRIVPFDQRLDALKIRYPYYVEKMERAESAIWDLSDEICEILDIPSHAELVEMLRKELVE